MIRIDLGTGDLGNGGKGSKNPLKKLFDRLRMRNARGGSSARVSADPFAASSVGLFSRLAGVGTVFLIVIALIGAVVPHFAYEQYREFVVKKNEETKKELQGQLDSITKEIARLVPFQKELESYEAQKKLLRERLDLIQNLLASRSAPVNVLDAIGQSLPTKAWLTSIDFDAKAARPTLVLNGQALTNDEVADYLDKLGESVHFSDVSLESLNFTRGSGAMSTVDVKSFVVTTFPKGVVSTNGGVARAVAAAPAAATPAPGTPGAAAPAPGAAAAPAETAKPTRRLRRKQ